MGLRQTNAKGAIMTRWKLGPKTAVSAALAGLLLLSGVAWQGALAQGAPRPAGRQPSDDRQPELRLWGGMAQGAPGGPGGFTVLEPVRRAAGVLRAGGRDVSADSGKVRSKKGEVRNEELRLEKCWRTACFGNIIP